MAVSEAPHLPSRSYRMGDKRQVEHKDSGVNNDMADVGGSGKPEKRHLKVRRADLPVFLELLSWGNY